MTALAPTLQAFFTERLPQRRASPHTVAAYRDAWRLLLTWNQTATGTPPCKLDLEDLDAKVVAAFLDHIQTDRGAGVATRNARLAAIHSFFAFADSRHPEHAALISRVLAIPPKRADRTIVTFLSEAESEALLDAPDAATRLGRRDRGVLQVVLQTGLRASELTGLGVEDLHLGTGAHLCCHGKGRKDRHTPLTTVTVAILREWLAERGGRAASDPLFPGPSGRRLTRDALRRLVDRHVANAERACPSLANKRVTPHVLRHTCAMRLLEAGVDISVIALWLGHESPRTTQIYLHAHLALKEQALAKTKPAGHPPGRFRPGDRLLTFLESL